MNTIDQMEAEARELYRTTRGYARRVIGTNCDIVEVEIVSAMINRGMATGDAKRATWKINGKRASRAAVDQLAANQ